MWKLKKKSHGMNITVLYVAVNLLLNFALEDAVRRVQLNQDSLKLNGTHQLLVYADDVKILGGSVHTVEKNTEIVAVASKEIRLEVNPANVENTVIS